MLTVASLPCNSIWWTRGIKACILQRVKVGCGSMTTSDDVVEVFEEYDQATASNLPLDLYVEKAQPREQRVLIFKYTASKKHV
jgi:hypothetical protein